MKANRPGEMIHMSYVTTTTVQDGKVTILISVDNYSGYFFGVAIEKEMSIKEIKKHIESILSSVNENHPAIKPLLIIGYGIEHLKELEQQFKERASFSFNPVLADEVAMPAARELMQGLYKK